MYAVYDVPGLWAGDCGVYAVYDVPVFQRPVSQSS